MNPQRWADEILSKYDEEEVTTSFQAARLRESLPPGFFEDDGVQLFVLSILARNHNRALKKPSVRIPDQTERAYRPRRLLDIDDYRDVLSQKREEAGKYHAEGVRILREAVERGFEQLRFEFPEFDVD